MLFQVPPKIDVISIQNLSAAVMRPGRLPTADRGPHSLATYYYYFTIITLIFKKILTGGEVNIFMFGKKFGSPFNRQIKLYIVLQ